MAEDATPEVRVKVSSLYGHHSRLGLVKLQIGAHEWIWRPEEARRVARLLIESAEAADTDEFLMEQFMGIVGLPEQSAARVLREFRAARAAKYGEQV